MPRKKSETDITQKVNDVDCTEVLYKTKTLEKNPNNPSSADETGLENGTKISSDRTVGKLDSIDFYRTQLKLEGLESDIAKTDKEASEINNQILEIVKRENKMGNSIPSMDGICPD